MGAQLNERARYLLKVLIETYIRSGKPVGSRTLAEESVLDLSPATIRNVMAELEELGLISSPHTSAGRIPTDKGYRVFVDTLLTVEPVAGHEVEQLKELLGEGVTLQDVAESVSKVLSAVTKMAGLIMLPRRERQTLRHVEFVSLSDNRVLVILVINEHEVQNSIIRTERRYSESDLRQAANYLNSTFAGQDLPDVRQRLLGELRTAKDHMHRALEAAVRVAEQVFESGPGDDMVVAGETNLMEFHELSDLERLRVLFNAFHEKRQILHLLDQCVRTQGVQIFIGRESGYRILDDCSLVTSTYRIDDQVLGVLGVIGPTRMAYKRVIPLVDVTAKLVSAALNRGRETP